jgi:hypothetical protein
MKNTAFIFLVAASAALTAASTALFGQNLSDTYQFAAAGPVKRIFTYSANGPVVTGRPYSATEERHSTQTLGDGTHIETTETNRVFRDEQGRTRIERKDGTVSIHDPVEGFTVELEPATKTARKLVVARPAVFVPRIENESDRGKVESLRQGTDKAPQLRVAIDRGIEKVGIGQAVPEKVNPDGAYHQGLEAGQLTLAPPVPDGRRTVTYTTAFSPDTAAVLRVEPGNNGSVESLPPQMINGVLSAGTRTTETIPAGKIGNDRPIHIVNERWYSDALQLLIKSSSSDPRFGTTTYELTNVVQTAPDPSLFQIPADYTTRGLR